MEIRFNCERTNCEEEGTEGRRMGMYCKAHADNQLCPFCKMSYGDAARHVETGGCPELNYEWLRNQERRVSA